mgnify:CR=1 FL=1
MKRWKKKVLYRKEWVSIIREIEARLKGRNAKGRKRSFDFYQNAENSASAISSKYDHVVLGS